MMITMSRQGGPLAGEHPVRFADRMGAWHVGQVTEQHRQGLGLYLTPVPVAEFMAALVGIQGGVVRILDPAAGAGILLCAALEHLTGLRPPPRRVAVTAYEVDPALAAVLRSVLGHAASWAGQHGVEVAWEVRVADFILQHAGVLQPGPPAGGELYDVVIANPPYFKIARSDPRAAAAAAIVHGQPNIYGLFMAVGAALLRPGGRLVCITPRSFSAGPYFRALRRRLFSEIRPVQIHLFASRKEAFSRDEVLQENLILCGERRPGWDLRGGEGRITISTSRGAADLARAARRTASLDEVLRRADGDRVLRLPASDEEAAIVHRVASWPGSLRQYGLEISTGPVVPFRAADLLDAQGSVPRTHAPLLWMNHVTPMRVRWPLAVRKPEYIRLAAAGRSLLVPDRSYVLLRRFSAKEERRRLIAAPLLAGSLGCERVGLENHLNYVHRPGGTLSPEEALGLAALYNSALLDTYFRTANGNTQVSATELRAMPLPDHAVIVALGRRAAQLGDPGQLAQLDALVGELTQATSASRAR
jgi:adenine-specific DNA-methyltransferase